MARYELTLSPDYVASWGVVEAMREIFQNAIDQETENSDNEMSYDYDEDNQVFSISSQLSSLDKSSLLLGHSTKADNVEAIGKFGEGYKLAILVLSRMGFIVEILNYQAKEKWAPKIINSRRYNSKLLVIDVKKYLFTSPPSANLTFLIHGVTKEQVEDITAKFLFMQSEYKKLDTKYGEVLLDDKYKGCVFVKGLFVCKCEDKSIHYGYNVIPSHLRLDRDRTLVDTFDLTWMTSKLWNSFEDKEFVSKLIIDEIADVKYLSSHYTGYDKLDIDLATTLFDKFQVKHGATSVPVSTHQDLVHINTYYPKLKPIITSEVTKVVASKASSYIELMNTSRLSVSSLTPAQQLRKFYDTHMIGQPDKMQEDFKELIVNSENWREE